MAARPRPADALPPRQECGPATKGHYKELMNKFPLVRGWRCRSCLPARRLRPLRAQVVDAFLKLNKGYQLAIADVTKRMGEGMAEFIAKDVRRCARAELRSRGLTAQHRRL